MGSRISYQATFRQSFCKMRGAPNTRMRGRISDFAFAFHTKTLTSSQMADNTSPKHNADNALIVALYAIQGVGNVPILEGDSWSRRRHELLRLADCPGRPI